MYDCFAIHFLYSWIAACRIGGDAGVVSQVTMTQAMQFSAFKGPFAEAIDDWNNQLYMVRPGAGGGCSSRFSTTWGNENEARGLLGCALGASHRTSDLLFASLRHQC